MKKRILSLLLLLCMAVTALPLVAFPAMAAEEEKVYKEADYNALYVQDGLLFAMDLYKNNPFWNPTGEGFSLSAASYYWKGSISNVTLGAVSAGYFNTANLGANTYINGTNAPIGEDGTLAVTQEVVGAFGVGAVLLDANGLMIGAKAAADDDTALGFANFRWDCRAHLPILRVGSATGTIPAVDVLSGAKGKPIGYSLVMSAEGITDMGGVFDWTGIELPSEANRPKANANDFYVGFKKVDNGDGTFSVVESGDKTLYRYRTSEPEYYIDEATQKKYIVGVQGRKDTNHGTDGGAFYTDGGYLGLFANGKALFETTAENQAYYPRVVEQYCTSYVNRGSAYDLYAMRYYTRNLSADEVAQNSFVDLLKWYRLDYGTLFGLRTDARLEIIKTVIAYAAENGIGVGGTDEAKRTALQTELSGKVTDALYEQLPDETPEALAFLATSRAVLADITGVFTLPAVYRSYVYACVNALTAQDKESNATVQQTIDSAIDKILEDNYGQYINKVQLDYKELYVRQENLILWADFFAAREEDGNLYMDHSYTEQTMGLKLAEREKVPQISGEAAAREKYIYRGSKFLTFADIGDAGFPHTNIRTWGNGYLQSGLNNTWKINSPGLDTAQVTYQIVAGWTGNGQNGLIEIELDGFRAQLHGTAGGNAGTFRLHQYTYYDFGTKFNETVTLQSAALKEIQPGLSPYYAGPATDLTITVDKFFGADTGHYYTGTTIKNEDGADQYLEGTGTTVPKDSNYVRKLYRYQIDGTWYYIGIEGEGEEKTYTAYYAENLVGKIIYVRDPDFYRVSRAPVKRDAAGKMYVDWESVPEEDYIYDDMGFKIKDSGTTVTVVHGPQYDKNSFVEVPYGTEGAMGPYFYAGTCDLGFYTSGQEHMYIAGIKYTKSDAGWFGNYGNLATYAIRTYDCVLTEAEMKQNHFADLAGFYGYDLSSYALLTDEERAILHDRLSTVSLGLTETEGIAAYEAAIAELLYSFFDTSLPGASAFSVLCNALSLDTREMKRLSPESVARILSAFDGVDPEGRHYAPIVQKTVNDGVEAERADHYAAAYGHNTISFEGWQVKKEGQYGLRALYSTNLAEVYDIEDHGGRVMTGVLVAPYGEDFDSLDDLVLTVEDGEISVPEGVTLAKGYWDGDFGEKVEKKGDVLYFTEDTLFDITEDTDDDTAIDVMANKAYFYVGFAVLIGDDGAVSVFLEDATVGGETGAESLLSLSSAAKNAKMTEPNIQKVMNLCAEEGYIAVKLGGTTISNFRVVISSDVAEAAALQNAVRDAVGFKLGEAKTSDTVGKSGFIFIGAVDNVYGDACYGMMMMSGNLYLWYNRDAKAADACALFIDYLAAALEEGEDVYLASDISIVGQRTE